MIELRVVGTLFLTLACGGGTQASANASAPSSEEVGEGADPDVDAHHGGTGEARRDPCASGTCTPCGEALCLSGFYCEEAVSACGWVPDCAESPSCSCLEKYLEGCRCDERGGGVYVSCDG